MFTHFFFLLLFTYKILKYTGTVKQKNTWNTLYYDLPMSKEELILECLQTRFFEVEEAFTLLKSD